MIDEALAADELVLVTKGRRTGREHTVALWFAREGDALWLRADATNDWYRNLLHEPRCLVRIGAVEIEGARQPIPDENASLRHVVELLRAKYGVEWVADWYVEHGRVPVRIAVGGAVRP